MMETADRINLFQLAWTCWAFAFNGFSNGLIGPSLPDIAYNIHQSSEEINTILPVAAAGNFLGVVVSQTCLSSKYNSLYISVSLLFGVTVTCLIPFATTLHIILLLFLMQGFSKGFLDAYCFIFCLCLFPLKHDWQMLSISVTSAFAAFIIAILMRTFESQHVIHDGANITSTNECTIEICSTTENGLIYPYIIVASVLIPPIVVFLCFFIKNLKQKAKQDDYNTIIGLPSVEQTQQKKKLLFVILLFLFHIPAYGSLITYSHLLTLYGISSPMFQPKSVMVTITALFWVSVLFGRVTNALLSKYVDMQRLICLNFVGLVIFSIILFVFKFNITYIWVGSAGYGFFQSSFLPSVMSWAGSFLGQEITILYTSLLANGIGETIIPYTTVFLFYHFNHNILMTVIFSISFIELGVFLIISALKTLSENKKENQ